MEFLQSESLAKPIGSCSQAIRVNGFIYTSALLPVTAQGEMLESDDIKEQTRQIFNNLKTLLEDSQSGMNSVVKVSIYLENIDNFAVVNVLFAEAFGDHKPVRTIVSVKDLPLDSLIVIDVLALPNDFY